MTKAPGSDDLSVRFYKKFWPSTGDLVVDALNLSYHTGFLLNEQAREIMTLILNPGKDSTSIQNYRLITVLNTDYKIGAKAITARLKRVFSKVITTLFSIGFSLRARFIGETVHFVLDLIDYTDKK